MALVVLTVAAACWLRPPGATQPRPRRSIAEWSGLQRRECETNFQALAGMVSLSGLAALGLGVPRLSTM